MRAVNEFSARHGLPLELWTGDGLPTYSLRNA